ncbi:MAG: hypothetical protein R3C05_30205 [Pirellulaceae bacterium]
MQATQMRPTFAISMPFTARDAADKIRTEIRRHNLQHCTRSKGVVAEFFVEPEDCRYWSPHLSLQLHDTEPGQSQLFGRFSPRPEVWTLVMFVYAFSVFIMFAASIWGYAQWMLGARPWALLLIPLSILVIGLLHVASLIGQSWSSDQIELLRRRLDLVLSAVVDPNALEQPTSNHSVQA